MAQQLARWLDRYLVVVSLLVILITFSLTAENFLSQATLSAILNQLPALTLVTVGMTFVLICGGIDLSVGSVLALSSAVIGVSVAAGFSIPAAALAGILAGGLACWAVICVYPYSSSPWVCWRWPAGMLISSPIHKRSI